MRTLAYATAILILATSPATAQMQFPKDSPLSDVNESDVHWNIVQAEVKRITKDDPESPVGNKLEMVGRIEGKAIRSLFPNWVFYALSYSNYKKPGFDDQPASLASGLGHTLAIAPDSRRLMRFSHYGSYVAYGHLLRETKAAIRNAEDAKLVWNAFCAIHRKAWEDHEVERVAENMWKLGIYSYDETISVVDGVSTIVKRTHFMQVATDPTSKQITSWKSIVETSDKRVERTP